MYIIVYNILTGKMLFEILGCFFCLCSSYFMMLYYINRRLPPGPPVVFVYLELLKKRSRYPCDQFRILRQKYGDVFSLSLGHKTTVILNGYKCIQEVFVDNGRITSNRPDNFFFKYILHKKGKIHN